MAPLEVFVPEGKTTGDVFHAPLVTIKPQLRSGKTIVAKTVDGAWATGSKEPKRVPPRRLDDLPDRV